MGSPHFTHTFCISSFAYGLLIIDDEDLYWTDFAGRGLDNELIMIMMLMVMVIMIVTTHTFLEGTVHHLELVYAVLLFGLVVLEPRASHVLLPSSLMLVYDLIHEG